MKQGRTSQEEGRKETDHTRDGDRAQPDRNYGGKTTTKTTAPERRAKETYGTALAEWIEANPRTVPPKGSVTMASLYGLSVLELRMLCAVYLSKFARTLYEARGAGTGISTSTKSDASSQEEEESDPFSNEDEYKDEGIERRGTGGNDASTSSFSSEPSTDDVSTDDDSEETKTTPSPSGAKELFDDIVEGEEEEEEEEARNGSFELTKRQEKLAKSLAKMTKVLSDLDARKDFILISDLLKSLSMQRGNGVDPEAAYVLDAFPPEIFSCLIVLRLKIVLGDDGIERRLRNKGTGATTGVAGSVGRSVSSVATPTQASLSLTISSLGANSLKEWKSVTSEFYASYPGIREREISTVSPSVWNSGPSDPKRRLSSGGKKKRKEEQAGSRRTSNAELLDPQDDEDAEKIAKIREVISRANATNGIFDHKKHRTTLAAEAIYDDGRKTSRVYSATHRFVSSKRNSSSVPGRAASSSSSSSFSSSRGNSILEIEDSRKGGGLASKTGDEFVNLLWNAKKKTGNLKSLEFVGWNVESKGADGKSAGNDVLNNPLVDPLYFKYTHALDAAFEWDPSADFVFFANSAEVFVAFERYDGTGKKVKAASRSWNLRYVGSWN